MPSFRRGYVGTILEERQGLQRVLVSGLASGQERAYVLTTLTGPVSVGDEVLYNTTAVELGLGTGGWHVVHANLSAPAWSAPGNGHIMKLRYTSLQADTGSAEEHLDQLPADLSGMPVVACSLHSQMALVAVALAEVRPGTRVVYVMTDGAALPMALSDLVHQLTGRSLLAGTITAGHAFGGDLEAVGVPSALALARDQLGADVVLVGMGPGAVGTGLALGTTALEVAPALDAAAWLGGQPVACLRVSDGDPRPRHLGVSHHSLTVLDAVRSRVTVPSLPGLLGDHPAIAERHDVRVVDATAIPDVAAAVARHGMSVTTMGRGPDQEPRFFAICGAAAVVAGTMVDQGAPRP